MIWKLGKANVEARIEREKERFRSPRTESGSRIGSSELLLFGVVVLFIMALLTLAPSTPIVHLVIFGMGVAALSNHGRNLAIPFIYNLMAAKFGWPDYEAARAEEARARMAEASGKNGGAPEQTSATSAPAPRKGDEPTAATPILPVEARPGSAPEMDSHTRAVLAAFLALDKAARKARVLQVSAFCQAKGFTLPGLADAEDEEEKVVLGEIALKKLAKQNGVEVAHEHAG